MGKARPFKEREICEGHLVEVDTASQTGRHWGSLEEAAEAGAGPSLESRVYIS